MLDHPLGEHKPYFKKTSASLLSPKRPGLPRSGPLVITAALISPYACHATLLPEPYPDHARSMSLDNAALPPTRQLFLPTPRQIRFISSEGPPHAKRRRINAACLTCRKRKTRCSGEKPCCKTCTDNGHSCAGYAIPRNSFKANTTRNDEEEQDEEEDDTSDDIKHPRTSQSGHSKETPAGSGPHSIKPESATASVSQINANDDHVPGMHDSTVQRRVPFFRYFGPTAIAPGFKQMVVQVRNRNHRKSNHSFSGLSEDSLPTRPRLSKDLSYHEPIFYDPTEPIPVPDIINKLCDAFFDNLGDHYPFLPRERFMKDLKEKKVDVILVDAVCAIAARFCTERSLTRPCDASVPLNEDGDVERAFRGQPYAQRAAHAVIDTFGCPTISVAQACLLLAYEEFGTDKDSGLWMFLGTAIRMAQDLGIQKLEGMHLEGLMGPTPKTVKQGERGTQEEARRAEEHSKRRAALVERAGSDGLEDRRASENERIDTFWAIFFLDRAVSSGVGRPATLRDKAIEISFPWRPDETMINGYPHPYPVMIRIVHLYGRIADVINNIKHVEQITPEVLQRLTSMEKDLTNIYQAFSYKLCFNATNFQHYVKEGQAANFILLHFWFHTSIILLHLPTILHAFEGPIQQLFPESRELSMSSAKTIADIVTFAELIDLKSFIGNPFTSQPLYIAACAFLAETRANASQPASRQASPPSEDRDVFSKDRLHPMHARAAANKHSLLATIANQNYQRCYKALKLLNTYWAGCRYIITALDQKSKGLLDPILFTQDDIDGEMPSIEPSFTVPGWRTSPHNVTSATPRSATPAMNWNHAIGWSLSGNTNSTTANLAFLHPAHERRAAPASKKARVHSSALQNLDESTPRDMPIQHDEVGVAPDNSELITGSNPSLGMSAAYNAAETQHARAQVPTNLCFMPSQPDVSQMQPQPSLLPSASMPQQHSTYGDMLVASRDLDMSHPFTDINFDGFDVQHDMLPWLEYLPDNVMSYFNPAEYTSVVAPHYDEQPHPEPQGSQQHGFEQHDFATDDREVRK